MQFTFEPISVPVLAPNSTGDFTLSVITNAISVENIASKLHKFNFVIYLEHFTDHSSSGIEMGLPRLLSWL